MKISFKNLETNNNITLETDKSLIVIYGKNGSGKTTLSKSNCFDKKYVFNDDFVYSNVYNITDSGASQTVITKENFSGLWLGEDIVKSRQEINSILILEKKLKELSNGEENKLMKIFADMKIAIDLTAKKAKLEDKNFHIEIDDYEDQRDKYKSKYIYNTGIENDNQFDKKLTYYKKNDIYNMLVSKIKNNNLLSELILGDANETVDNINSIINELMKQKKIIDEVEIVFKDDNLNQDLIRKIHDWYELHVNRVKCVFCGNNNIKYAMDKWKNVFTNEYVSIKEKLIKELECDLTYYDDLIKEPEYMMVDKDVIDTITELASYLRKYIDDISNNEFAKFKFEIKYVKKEIAEVNDLIDDLVNYVLNKHKNILGFYINSLRDLELLKAEKMRTTDKLMLEQGKKIANSINQKFEKFGLNKNIKIEVDKYSRPHKFTYSIKNHGSINELSDGQKHKLALAIFMNYLEEQNLADKTIVIDDPVVSLDIPSYIMFKQYLLNDLIKRKFTLSTRLIILTHDITYLYIQLSNIFEDEGMRNITQIYKLNGKKIEEIPLDFIKTDDITLFRNAIDNVCNLTELRILNSLLNKIFRIELDLKFRFYGRAETDNMNVRELPLNDNEKELLKNCEDYIVETSRRDNPSNEDIRKNFQCLKDASDILGFKDFVTSIHMENIDRIINNETDGSIQYELFNVIETVRIFLKSDANKNFKHYIEHPRNSYTRNLIGLGLDDYYE